MPWTTRAELAELDAEHANRMTLAETEPTPQQTNDIVQRFWRSQNEKREPQQVWLLWRNEVVCGVFGSEAAAYREVMEMQTVIGAVWDRVDDFARVWYNRSSGVTLRMEPREVHR